MPININDFVTLLTAISVLVLGLLQFRNQKRKTESDSVASEATAANTIADTAVNVLIAPLRSEIAELRARIDVLERIEAAYRYLRGEVLKYDMPMAVQIADEIASGKRQPLRDR